MKKHKWTCEVNGKTKKCIAFDLDGMTDELNNEKYEEDYDRIYWPDDPVTMEILKLAQENDEWKRVANLHRLAALDQPTGKLNRGFETQYEMGPDRSAAALAAREEYDRIASAAANDLMFVSTPLPAATQESLGLLDERSDETPPGELPSEDVPGRS